MGCQKIERPTQFRHVSSVPRVQASNLQTCLRDEAFCISSKSYELSSKSAHDHDNATLADHVEDAVALSCSRCLCWSSKACTSRSPSLRMTASEIRSRELDTTSSDPHSHPNLVSRLTFWSQIESYIDVPGCELIPSQLEACFGPSVQCFEILRGKRQRLRGRIDCLLPFALPEIARSHVVVHRACDRCSSPILGIIGACSVQCSKRVDAGRVEQRLWMRANEVSCLRRCVRLCTGPDLHDANF